MEDKNLIRICPKCGRFNNKIHKGVTYDFKFIYEECKEPIGIKFYLFGIFTKVKYCNYIGLTGNNHFIEDHWLYGHKEGNKLVYDKVKSRYILY